jgi:hypothetical protein
MNILGRHFGTSGGYVIAALAACFLGLPGRARADVFNYLSAPVDVTPGSTSAWVDVNVSANVPAGATGVILQMLNTSGSSTYHYGVRNNGSTDGWMVGTQATALAGSTSLFMVGVDGSRIFECYIQNTAVKTYLLGYTTAGATFFTNAVDKSTTTTGSYVDIDISGDTGANTAIGAIFIIKNTSGTAKTFNLRKNGSSDDRYTSVMAGWATMALIGVDGSELCEQKIFDTTMDAYLVGYITSGAVLFTNAVAKTTGTTGSYVDTDITGDIAADDATGAILEFTASSGYATAVRKNGASYDYYGYIQHGWGICAIDNGDIFEQKIGNSNMDLYLVGYTLHTTTVYRSVGTNTGTLYSTGNCSISAGASTVTFAGGASLPSNVGAGDRLTIGGSTVYYILSRDSATQVTVQETADAASSGAAYTITRAYNDFQTWETARDGNLVTGERSEVAVAYDDGDFTTATTINGSTTSASYYMSITVASGQGHSGVAGAGVLIDMNNASSAITVSDDYVRITGLQFRRCAGAAGRFAVRLNNGNNALLEQLIIYDFDTDTTCRGIRNSTATGTIVRNCIIYGGEGYGIHADTGSVSLTVQNCTVYGMTGTGILQGAGTLTATNCVSVGNSTADLGGTITQSYNVSSDASASGAGSLSGKYAGNQFVSITAGSEDLHLKSGADAVNAGSDLSASFSGDVDGVNRPAGSAWDIGADERSAGSTDANYRSVGTNAGTIYGTGTCSISAGATTATFASATLPANVGPGDKLTVGSHVFYLLSRDSATQATVQVAASAAITNQAYTITRAYNDFATWESDRDGDLVTDNRQETAVGYDDGDFTPGATITIDGSTTDATRYMMITVASGQRHEGVAGTGVLIDLADAASAIAASDDYTRIEWLQLYQFSGAATRAGVVVAASNVLVENVLASDFSAGTPSNGILCNSGTVTVRNCIVYTGGIGLATNGGTMTAQNCTVGDMLSYGVRNASGTLTATNVISAVGATACFSGTITQSYNLSTDATATGTGSLTSVDVNDLFVSIIPGSIDLHLKGGSDGIDAGTDLSASFTGDIDEETRPVAAAWDMGADERSVTVTNYRSVGTDAATLYSTGTASISSGTSTATFGGGASLPANVGQGDKLTIGGTDFYVLSRDSATQATVQETASSTLTDEAYTIVRAYNDLQSWETARQGNLVADGRVEVAVAWDDGDFTSALTIDGSTTSAMNYMAITVPSGQRHNGQSGAGAVLDMSNTATGITVSDDYVRISWLQVRRTGGASLRSGVMVSNAAGVVLDGLLIYDFNGAAGIYGVCAAPNGSATVRNCVVYDGTGSGLITAAASSTLTVESCTVYGITGRGVYESAGTITATNTIAMDCSTEDFSSGVTQSYNMSSDASASGAGSLPGRTASDELVYVLAGNWNLHLKPGSDAVDAGSDLSASFTTDVDHGTRAAPWDIGADEHGVSGAGQKLTPRIASWREAAP